MDVKEVGRVNEDTIRKEGGRTPVRRRTSDIRCSIRRCGVERSEMLGRDAVSAERSVLLCEYPGRLLLSDRQYADDAANGRAWEMI